VKDNEKRWCPHCGASMNMQKHTMSRMLVECLAALKVAGGKAFVREMNLPTNGGPNFQKLRYWGLVVKEGIKDEGGDSRWIITSTGEGFLAGMTVVSKAVYTYRGDLKEWSDNFVSYAEVMRKERRCKRRVEYERDAVAFTGE
jgi:hypothetical protein